MKGITDFKRDFFCGTPWRQNWLRPALCFACRLYLCLKMLKLNEIVSTAVIIAPPREGNDRNAGRRWCWCLVAERIKAWRQLFIKVSVVVWKALHRRHRQMSAKIPFCPSQRLECQAFTTHSYACMFTQLNIKEAPCENTPKSSTTFLLWAKMDSA